MATNIVENPFQNYSTPTTAPAPAPVAAPAPAPAPGVQPTPGLIDGALPTTPSAANVYTSTVDKPTETVQGQLDSILANDSPLLQRARTLASQGMNARGLVNSSMAQGAGVAAMIDAATPIAQSDANTYSGRTQQNVNNLNSNSQFNAGQTNAWNMAQQELKLKGDQFNQNLQFQYEELAKKYDLSNDEAFDKQYQAYVDAIFQIDKDTNLTAEAKLAMKYQQARILRDYATLRGMNLNLDFSNTFQGTGATQPANVVTEPVLGGNTPTVST